MENTALCVTNFEPLKVKQFVNQKCFKPVKALRQYEKNTTRVWVSSPIQHLAPPRAVLVSLTHTVVLFFPYCTCSGG